MGAPVAGKKILRNEACPCGSGKKYKHCCLKRGARWEVNEKGEFLRVLPLTQEGMELLQRQREGFVKRHGREPRPDERVFEDAPHAEYTEYVMVETMKKAGIRPELIYAYEKTGRIVTEANQRYLTQAQRAEWQAALEEYRTKYSTR